MDGFTVLYRRYDAADGSYQRQTVSGSSSRHAVLRQLDTDTAYSIVIRSFNRHGQSDLSNTVVMTTFGSAAATRDHLGLSSLCHYVIISIIIFLMTLQLWQL